MKPSIGKEYIAPWERVFDRVLTPLEEFIHRQTTSAILLMFCAIAALYIANSQWSDVYHSVLGLPLQLVLRVFNYQIHSITGLMMA